MSMFRFPLALLLSVCSLGALTADGWAQDPSTSPGQGYPSKPVRYMVPSSAGSAVDTIGRIVAGGLTEVLGQQVVVENRAGAGGNIGAAVVAKAAPDGYTVVQVNNNHSTNVTLYKNPGYDLARDFAPVTYLASSPYVFVVHPSLPVKSMGDLIKLAKARPGAITYASAGAGSGTFMVTALLTSQTGLNMLHVPYNGGGPALTSVVAGETVVYGSPLSVALPFIRQGKLRPLGLSTAKRLALLPDYPTVAETVSGYEFTAWAGIMVPVKTPREIVATLHSAAVKALNRPEVSKRLSDLGYVPVGGPPNELAAYINTEIDKMAKLIRQNNLTAN